MVVVLSISTVVVISQVLRAIEGSAGPLQSVHLDSVLSPVLRVSPDEFFPPVRSMCWLLVVLQFKLSLTRYLSLWISDHTDLPVVRHYLLDICVLLVLPRSSPVPM